MSLAVSFCYLLKHIKLRANNQQRPSIIFNVKATKVWVYCSWKKLELLS